MMKINFQTIIFLIFIITFGSANPSFAKVNCSELFTIDKPPKIESDQSIFSNDFGANIYIKKTQGDEIYVVPPPRVLKNIQHLPLIIQESAELRPIDDRQLTIITIGLSELDVFSIKSLMRKNTIKSTDPLFILLGKATSDKPDYTSERPLALTARDGLDRRLNWDQSTVTRVESDTPHDPLNDVYRIDTPFDGKINDSFLLTIRVSAKRFLIDKTKKILSILNRSNMARETTEEVARALIKDIRKHSPGINSVTMKVNSADFIIATNQKRFD